MSSAETLRVIELCLLTCLRPVRVSLSELWREPPCGRLRLALPTAVLPNSAETVALPGSDKVTENAKPPLLAREDFFADPALSPTVGALAS